MPEFNVKIKLDVEKLETGDVLAQAMDAELKRFQDFFMTRGSNAPLIGMERSLLKTYLAWKLLYEEGAPGNAETVQAPQ